MNALVTAKLPPLSASLRQIIAAPRSSSYGARNEDDPGLRIAYAAPTPTPDQVVEARSVLAGYVALQGSTPRAVTNWLFDLNMAVANTQSPQTFEMRSHAIGGLLAKYPSQVFTTETLHDAMQSFNFFPSTKELCELLDRHLRVILDTEAKLRSVAAYREPEPDPTVLPTDAEKEAVTHMLQAWRAEQAATSIPEPDREPLPDVTLSDEQLLRRYEALAEEGDKLAGMAAAAIRGRLAALAVEAEA